MMRRRSVPWIYRWSRTIIGSIAIVGAILTGYLTFEKLTGSQVACTVGCDLVLNSPYGQLFGLPLSLFGCLAYLSMTTFSLGPLLIDAQNNRSLRNQVEDVTWLLLLIGSASMAVFSGYLMYVLATKIQVLCPYCITSALLSLTLLVLTIKGRDWPEIGQIIFPIIIAGVITLVGTLAVYANVENPGGKMTQSGKITSPTTLPQPPYGWEITTTSGSAEIALAEHLNQIGAKMYAAFWCPHCYEQKELFGKEATEKLSYIECAPQGKNPNPQACEEAKIQSFPTWKIKGKTYLGTQELKKLAEISGYTGPKNFKYTMR